MHIVVEQVDAIVETGASASVVGMSLPSKLGIWKQASKVKVRQEDESILGGNSIVNSLF